MTSPNCSCNCQVRSSDGETNYRNYNFYDGTTSNCDAFPCRSGACSNPDDDCRTNCNNQPKLPLKNIQFPPNAPYLITLVKDDFNKLVKNDEIVLDYIDIRSEDRQYWNDTTKNWQLTNNQIRVLVHTISRTLQNTYFNNIFTQVIFFLKKMNTPIQIDNDHIKYMISIYLRNNITRVLALSEYSDELNTYSFDQLFNLLTEYVLFLNIAPKLAHMCSIDLATQYGWVPVSVEKL